MRANERRDCCTRAISSRKPPVGGARRVCGEEGEGREGKGKRPPRFVASRGLVCLSTSYASANLLARVA